MALRLFMKAAFIDKDGTLIEDVPYNVDPRHIRFMPGAIEGVSLLYRAGYDIILVSNQAGVAQGYFSEDALGIVEARIRLLFADNAIPLAGFYYCPHHPEARLSAYRVKCSCRKPAPGMLLTAALEHGYDLNRSWMIGDILDDIEAGHRAGSRSILVDSGHENEWNFSGERTPDFKVSTLEEAAHTILIADELNLKLRPFLNQIARTGEFP